jgi:hypothetical protein
MSFRNIDSFDKQAQKALEGKMIKALDDASGGSYADELKNRIVKRTQLGVGVNDDGEAFPLPGLSQSYKDQRSGKVRFYKDKKGKLRKILNPDKKPKLATTTKATKANNTATGQLLKAITVVKTKISGGVKFIFAIGDDRGLDMYGKPSEIGNKKLNKYLKDMGRGFFGFTKAQRNQIRREIRQILIRLLR